ncbi:MAG: histidine kinase [Actinomycetota bacterium]
MTERTTTRLAWSLCILAIAGGSAFVLLEATGAMRSFSATFLGNGQEAFGAIAFATVGALIVSRGKRNAIGWLFLAIGLSYGLSAVGSALLDTTVAGSTMWQWGIWLNTWSWVPGWFLMVTLLFLLFPDGHLPSARWRWVAWLGVVAVVLAIVGGELSPTAGGSTLGYVSPLPTAPDTVANLGLILSMLCLVVAAVASVVALIGRYRRSTGEERLQMKWFVYAAVVSLVLTPTRSVVVHQPVLLFFGLLSTLILPLAVGVAILKYRLYDIDVVIRKTVVFAIAVAMLTVAFVAGAALAGALVSGSDSAGRVGVAFAVGLLFEPARRLASRIADRVVFGGRATPYEVLSEFSRRAAEAYEAEDVLPRIAQVAASGVGAKGARVWIRVDDTLQPQATVGEIEHVPSVAVTGNDLPELPDDHAEAVFHRGSLLGAIGVSMPANDPMSAEKERLIADLASQAGAILANVRLIEELRASRQRLVAAQDEERRKIERNIHDGAQQQLVALAVKLRLAEQMVERDAVKTKDLLAQLQTETGAALEDLRDLARGIYPPLLADKGLSSALDSQARKVGLPVTVFANGIGRYAQEIEAAVYFSCLEALQNVSKYARASNVRIELTDGNGELAFRVIDDGCGFNTAEMSYGTGLQGIADRLSVLDGVLEIRSAPDEGTTLAGRLPAEARGSA